jgi:hypothetical protein
MPVVGLPTTVEVALGSLLAEKSVSSWKITGQGDTTVVVLRLRGDSPVQDGGDSMAKGNNVYYRRKNPSQLRRDRQRAAERKLQKCSELEASALNVHASSFSPVIEHELFVDTDADRPTLDDNATPTFTCTNDDATRLPHSNVPSVSIDSHVGLAKYTSQKPSADVFGAQVVKEYVGAIFDKVKLQNLRNQKRNTKFNSVCQVNIGKTKRIACCSDDVVIVLDSETGKWKYWFVVQQTRHMLEEEKAWLHRMQTGTQVDRDKRLMVTKAEQDLLPTLMDMISFFLG